MPYHMTYLAFVYMCVYVYVCVCVFVLLSSYDMPVIILFNAMRSKYNYNP